MTTPTREQVVRDAFESKYGDIAEWVSELDYDSAFDDFEAGYNAARADLEPTIAEQAKQLEEMAEAIRVKDVALARLVDGVTFIYGERAAHGAILSAKEALAILPSPEILAARDQRVAEAFVMKFKRHVGGDGEFWLHELEDFCEDGKWREYL